MSPRSEENLESSGNDQSSLSDFFSKKGLQTSEGYAIIRLHTMKQRKIKGGAINVL